MKQHVLLVLATVALTALAYAIGDSGAPVQAKSDEPVCVPFATLGNIVMSRCTDPENGNIIYANNIGMFQVAP